jgi:hypothetical protein
MIPIVFNFGAPRTGGTWMRCMLEKGVGYAARKLPELSPLHPCKSDKGLLGLMAAVGRPFLFVRTLRHPLEIVRSWYSLRTVDAHPASIGHAADETILQMLVAERDNTASQMPAMAKVGWNQHVLIVRYEDLDDPRLAPKILDAIARALPLPKENALRFREYHRDTWRKVSVWQGRLELGIERDPLTAEQRRWWSARLESRIAEWQAHGPGGETHG